MSGHSVLYKLTCRFFSYPSHSGCGFVQRAGRKTLTLLKNGLGNPIRISESLKLIIAYNLSWKIECQDIVYFAFGKSESTKFILTFDPGSNVRGPSVIFLFLSGLFPRIRNRRFLCQFIPTLISVITGLYVNFFAHSTGATEVDSFIAQTKKFGALLDISKISENNHRQCS